MAISHLNLPENSLKPNKFQTCRQKGNGISFWAFLLSIFIYISIFYIFNLSPSSLLNTTKFWFFISNTLILIIAADFGAFSSSRKQAEFYEEYVKNSRANSLPSFESQYREIVKTRIPLQKVENSQETQEKVKEVVIVHKSEFQENKLQIVVKDDLNKSHYKNFQEKVPESTPKAENEAHEEKKNEASPATDIENKIVLRRRKSEKHEADEEEDEYSTMSDDELNRRVEEFIRRSNRQIRLQPSQN